MIVEIKHETLPLHYVAKRVGRGWVLGDSPAQVLNADPAKAVPAKTLNAYREVGTGRRLW